MCIFTAILGVISSKHVTTRCVKVQRQFILKVTSPFKNICRELCLLTNRFKADGSHSSGITNTSVYNSNANNLTSILTNSTNSCSSNSTITITIDNNFRCSGVSSTSSNDSDRNDTTIDNNWLCNSTFTRIQFNFRR